MGFDIFCAVCAGPACAYITICPKSRRAVLRQKREENPDFSETDLDPREFKGYDPEVVSMQDVEWTHKAQVLGFNPQAIGVDKMYITHPAGYEDYGCMGGVESNDPNFPTDSDEFQCYRVYDATQTACYPIHEPCLKLLTTVLCGDDKIGKLDKDALYHVISGLVGWGLPKLDYGEPSQGYDQCWWSRAGEEVMVAYPLNNPKFTLLLRNTVSTDDFALPPPPTADPATSSSLSARVRHDPFDRLPYDITHQVLLLLPARSVPALATASYTVHAAVRSSAVNPGFWRQALLRCMPWFRELHVLMRHGTVDPEETDFKGLFLWLEQRTRPRRWMDSAFMGVANRRRIWDVCEQYAALYMPRVAEKERARRMVVQSWEAAEIWRDAFNAGLPVVAWPVPEEQGLRTSATQWVCDWDEIERGAVLEATWDEERTLMGLTLVVGGQRRTFGSDGRRASGPALKEETIEIEEGFWIRGLVLHLPDLFLQEEVQTSIKGITVLMTNGEDAKLGDTSPNLCQRLLPISHSHVLVGITGQISATTTEGNYIRIARLGLLQHPDPNAIFPHPINEEDPPVEDHSPLLLQPLWTGPSSPTTTSPCHTFDYPIWSHISEYCPTDSDGNKKADHILMRALPSTDRTLNRYRIQNPWHEDIAPTYALVWARNAFERHHLVRLTAWLHDGARQGLCCVRAEYTEESGLAARTVGPPAVRRVIEGDGKGEMWSKEWMAGMREVKLEVDGRGGEEVVGVDAVRDDGINGIRIRTNQGQTFWGESPIKDYWRFENREADEGEKLVGIALAFTFGWKKPEVSHRWEDGSGMILWDGPRASWLATLVAKE